jgi:hypothetical protein
MSKLVRMKDELRNETRIAEGGYLWLELRPAARDVMWYRSISTGVEMPFYMDRFEEVEPDE